MRCTRHIRHAAYGHLGITGGTVVQNPPASVGDTGDAGSIPGSARPSGGGYGTPLLYSCLENPTDRGAWRATVHGVTKSLRQLKQLSTAHIPHTYKVTFVSAEVPWSGAGSGRGALADVSESMNLGIHALPRRGKGSAGLRACPSWAGAAPCWSGSSLCCTPWGAFHCAQFFLPGQRAAWVSRNH